MGNVCPETDTGGDCLGTSETLWNFHATGAERYRTIYHALEGARFDMNILLVGKNSNFTQLLVEKLDKEGHRIFLLTEEPKTVRASRKIFESYHFSYEDSCIRDVLSSIQPDAVIFMGAYDYYFKWSGTQNWAGKYTSGLLNVLLSFLAVSEGRFIYLSSEEVFQQEYGYVITEDEPSAAITTRGQAIAVGENICKYYQDMGKQVITLRLDHLYGTPTRA